MYIMLLNNAELSAFLITFVVSQIVATYRYPEVLNHTALYITKVLVHHQKVNLVNSYLCVHSITL